MINIAFCLDQKLKDHVFTVINSIEKNTSEKLRFFLLLSPAFDKSYIAKYKAKLYNIYENVDIIQITNYYKEIVKSKAMFNRWLIPEMLHMIDRAIYLDCDLILNTDIKNLWDIDLQGKAIGAVPCQFGQSIRDTIRYQGAVSDMDAFTDYNCDIDKRNFLSGQLLIDCKRWRQLDLTSRLIDYVVKNKTADMITMNVLCQNEIKPLDYLWSAPAKHLSEGLLSYSPCIHKDFSKAYIYHFHGKIKPWEKGYPNKKLVKMWEGYSK